MISITGTYAITGIISPGVSYAVGYGSILPIEDPLYHLCAGSYILPGCAIDVPLGTCAFAGAFQIGSDLPLTLTTRKIHISARPKATTSEDLEVPLGVNTFQRFANIGPQAANNLAYERNEKSAEHVGINGDVSVAASRFSSSFSRTENDSVTIGGLRFYAVNQQYCQSGPNEVPRLNETRAPNGFMTSSNTGVNEWHLAIGRSTYLRSRFLLHDIAKQLRDGGVMSWGLDYPGYGELPLTLGTGGRLSFDSYQNSVEGVKFRYRVETFSREIYSARVHSYYIELGIRREQLSEYDITNMQSLYAGANLPPEAARYQYRSFYDVVEKTTTAWTFLHPAAPYTWFRVPDVYTPVHIAGETPSLAATRTFYLGTCLTPKVRKIPIFCDLTQIGYQKYARSVTADRVAVNALYDTWSTSVQEDLYLQTDTNIWETLADLRNLKDMIPPKEILKKLPLIGNASSLLSVFQVVGAALLYHNFIIQPTLGEISEFRRAAIEYLNGIIDKLPEQDGFPVTYGSTAMTTEWGRNTVTHLISFKSVWAETPYKAILERLLKDFSAQLTIGNAWDLVPFSWAADYFLGIGDTLDRFDSLLHNIVAWPHYTVITRRSSCLVDARVFLKADNGAVLMGELELVNFDREITLVPPRPDLSIISVGFPSLMQFLNLGAVAINLL